VLAQRFVAAGHQVEIVSWMRQYPRRLYPGQQVVVRAEFSPFELTSRAMSWNRPDTWLRAAWRLRTHDLVLFAQVTPLQAVPYGLMLATLRAQSTRTVIICHNVLPHERRWGDRTLMKWLLSTGGRVVVHTASEGQVARSLTGRPVDVLPLAPFMPEAFLQTVAGAGVHRRLLFFGLVRPYKGLDVLLRALAQGPPDVQLRVAGEFWGRQYDEMVRLCHDLGIAERVEMLPGYVVATDVPGLFRDVDALVLPYRSATGSQGVWTGFEFGVPVVATRAGHLADDVDDGVDGLVAEPDDVDSLAEAIHRLYEPGVAERLRAAIRPVDRQPYWDQYIAGLVAPEDTSIVRNERLPNKGNGVHLNNRSSPPKAAPPGGRALHAAKIAAEQLLWARVAIQGGWEKRRSERRPWPSVVPSNDVLNDEKQYKEAIAECRRLRLPLHRDPPKNWDVLGAVSTVLHSLGTDIRVLDAGAARYSCVLPWFRLYGVRDLVGNNLEFTRVVCHGAVRFEPGDITAMSYGDGSFDAITCISVIEHGVPLSAFLSEAARILRPGGLLVVSTDYDERFVDTTGKTAYGAPVKIFNPEGIQELIALASRQGLELVGDLKLHHENRPVYWKRTGLSYTFIRLTLIRRGS
jgi:glycosyltransferase involved in cell wall biosynthesis/SAM-dependent methyltransferase